jgi:hypothetical protein
MPLFLGLLCIATSLWAQSPITSDASIGPTDAEAGTDHPFPSPRFGTTVAVDGRIAMASIPGDLATEPNEFGRVAVFEKTNSGWTRTATLIGTAESGGGFGSRIDIEGNRAVIGAAKAIYLFERRGPRWVQAARTVLAGEDSFVGKDIVLEQGQIITSLERHDGDIAHRVVHVYAHLRRGTLTRIAVIRPRNGLSDGAFGASLDADGPLLVVGAPNEIAPGVACVFLHWGRHWMQIDRLMASDATADDAFGQSVAVRAGLIVVGAPLAQLAIPETGTGPLHGNVYVFRPARHGWYESQKINEPGMESPHVGVGANVALGRGLLALFQDDNLNLIRNTQRVLVFDWVDGSFQNVQQPINFEDGIVADIDMAGRTLIASTQRRPDDFGFYYVTGAASILQFGFNGPEPPAPNDGSP